MTARLCKHCGNTIEANRIRCPCPRPRKPKKSMKGRASGEPVAEGQQDRIEVYRERAKRGEPLFGE